MGYRSSIWVIKYQLNKKPIKGTDGGIKIVSQIIETAKALLFSGIFLRLVAKNLGVSVPTLHLWIPASSMP
ncbi:MAG: hypothetical protein DCF19_17310 [Pseudanabaena frigida]|uniref:Uncharacterized protein n=1 Tax=Pseudanabaena frigida TaxID=945775 RepID=A0A2W4VYK8_9CYAN|nr:MAG: hypothetical protein DCF19_17310 [Pseudanabaena frigida]